MLFQGEEEEGRFVKPACVRDVQPSNILVAKVPQKKNLPLYFAAKVIVVSAEQSLNAY